LIFSLLFSTGISLFPYGYLLLKLRTIRVEGSYEAEKLISELINQYKINYYNMVEAVEACIPYLKDCPYSQNIMFRLSLGLKQYKTEEELQEVLKEFTYSINTEWIKMLSNNIYLAVEDGFNVIVSMEDILNELRSAKADLEESKRLNSESFAMIKYMTLAFYLITLYIAVKYFDFTVKKFFQYQLFTSIGLKYLVAILFLTLINFVIMYAFKKQKFDF